MVDDLCAAILFYILRDKGDLPILFAVQFIIDLTCPEALPVGEHRVAVFRSKRPSGEDPAFFSHLIGRLRNALDRGTCAILVFLLVHVAVFKLIHKLL